MKVCSITFSEVQWIKMSFSFAEPFKKELKFLQSLKMKFVCQIDDTEVKLCNQNIAFSTGKYKMHHYKLLC